jgi:hypothetical protein
MGRAAYVLDSSSGPAVYRRVDVGARRETVAKGPELGSLGEVG